jgi:hypothetical protein
MELELWETVQLLGLDVMTAVVLGILVLDAVGRLLLAAARGLLRLGRSRRRPAPAAPFDGWGADDWRAGGSPDGR